MKGKSKLAAAGVLAAAAAIFGACRADDTAELTRPDPGMSASKNASATTPANPTPPVLAQATPEEARRVTPAELKKMVDAGQAAIYDTRNKTAYDAEHIKGALSMPANEVADRAGELPKDKTLVFYCT